jgi:acetyltransferase-like isoleucine patch superfamily enzyme
MGFRIGNGSSIHLGCHFNSTRGFEMGQNSVINQYCHIDNRGGIKVGNNVSVSPHAAIVTADHDINDPLFTGRTDAVILEDYVFIGYGAKIFKGCTLAKGSVVGAMSLLTKSTEPFGIYLGIPAKLIKYRNTEVNYTTSYRRLFH